MKYALLLLVALLSHTAFAQDEDVSGSVQMQPTVWEPIITQFFVADVDGNHTIAKHTFAKPDGTPLPDDPAGDMQQWLMLKPLIAPRSAAYAATDNVVTGWDRLTNESDELEWRVYGSEDASELTEPLPARAPTVPAEGDLGVCIIAPKDGLVHIHLDLDVLINMPNKDKTTVLDSGAYKLSSLSVVAVKVADNSDKLRDAVPADAAPISVLSVGDPATGDGDNFALVAHTWNAPKNRVTWTVPAPAANGTVWELRLTARVTGKPGAHDDAATKTVTGAIRFVAAPDATVQSSPQSYTALRDGNKYGGGS